MLDNNKSTSSIDVQLSFLHLQLKATFECKVSLYVIAGTQKMETDAVVFSSKHPKGITDIKKSVSSTMILHQHKKNIISISVVLSTPKGKKCAGSVDFDVDEAMVSPKVDYVMHLSKCPDPNARLSFKFNYSNLKPVEDATLTPKHDKSGMNSTNMSFYSHFNNEDMSFNKANQSQDNSMMSLNVKSMARQRSKSPAGSVKLNFKPSRMRPTSRTNSTVPQKEFLIDSPKQPSKPNKFDQYYSDKRIPQVEDTKLIEPFSDAKDSKDFDHIIDPLHRSTNKDLEKKLKDLEDNFVTVSRENSKLKATCAELQSKLELYEQKSDGSEKLSDLVKLKAELQDLKTQIEVKEEAIFAAKLDHDESETKHDEYKRKSETRITALERKEKLLKKRNDELEEENFKIEEKYNDTKQHLFEVETALEQLKDQHKHYIDNLKSPRNNELSINLDKVSVERNGFLNEVSSIKSKNDDTIKDMLMGKDYKGEMDGLSTKDITQLEELKNELEKLKDQLVIKDAELMEIKQASTKQKERYETELVDRSNQIEQLTEKSKYNGDNIKDQLNTLEIKLEDKDEEISDLKSQIKDLRSSLNAPIHSDIKSIERIKELEQQLSDKQIEVDAMKRVSNNLARECVSRTNSMSPSNKVGDEQSRALAGLNVALEQKEEELLSLMEENQKKDSIIYKMKMKLDKYEGSKPAEANQDKDTTDSNKEELEEMKKNTDKLIAEIESKNTEIRNLKNRIEELEGMTQNNVNQEPKLVVLEEEKRILEEKLIEVQNNQKYNDQLAKELENEKKRVFELESNIEDIKKQGSAVKNKGTKNADDVTLLEIKNENLQKKVQLLEMRLKDSPSSSELENKVSKLEQENRNLQSQLGNGISVSNSTATSLDKNEYTKLEHNYIDSMRKIGDALMIVQSLNLKQNDKDRLLGALVG